MTALPNRNNANFQTIDRTDNDDLAYREDSHTAITSMSCFESTSLAANDDEHNFCHGYESHRQSDSGMNSL